MRKDYLKYSEDYLIDIKITRAMGTFKFYENHLLHFGRFLYERNITTIEEVNKNVIIDYLVLLRNTVSASTMNKRIGIIKRCFLFYGIDQHYIHSIKKYKEKNNTF